MKCRNCLGNGCVHCRPEERPTGQPRAKAGNVARRLLASAPERSQAGKVLAWLRNDNETARQTGQV